MLFGTLRLYSVQKVGAEATDDMLGSRNIGTQALILGRLVDLKNHLKDLDEQC